MNRNPIKLHIWSKSISDVNDLQWNPRVCRWREVSSHHGWNPKIWHFFFFFYVKEIKGITNVSKEPGRSNLRPTSRKSPCVWWKEGKDKVLAMNISNIRFFLLPKKKGTCWKSKAQVERIERKISDESKTIGKNRVKSYASRAVLLGLRFGP